MPRAVAVVSLYPLNDLGGGERYTFCVAQAIRASGDRCELFARSQFGPSTLPLRERLDVPFATFNDDERAAGQISARELLAKLADFDFVWVHQFLSSDIVFDIISTVTSDQWLLLTNLGHEPLGGRFRAFYCQSNRHCFVEISQYSADRSRVFGRRSVGVVGSVWRNQIAFPTDAKESPKIRRATAVGRVLPHKGLEVTISALPDDWELSIVGPLGDEVYLRYLQALAHGKTVRFLGPVSEEVKRSTIRNSLCLVASSCHDLFDGRKIVQAELLGLVIFEACAMNRLPLTSDVPSFKEVMNEIGLSDFTYPSRDSVALSRLMHNAFCRADEHMEILEGARQAICKAYLWDDYWHRVLSSIPETYR